MMKKATDMLPLYDDYRAFCKKPNLYNTTICNVYSADLKIHQNQAMVQFSITANRFLRGQIRIIVQKLLDIGLDKFTVTEFESYLRKETTPKLIKPAPASGLFLSKVEYPDLIFKNRATFLPPDNSWQEI